MNSTLSADGSDAETVSFEVVGVDLLVFVILDYSLGTIIMVTNGFLFFTIYHDPCRCLRTPSVFLIASLSVADFSSEL